MEGFPVNSAHKYINIMTENGYTVVLVDQNKEDKHIVRNISKVIDKTVINDEDDYTNKYILSIYITKQ